MYFNYSLMSDLGTFLLIIPYHKKYQLLLIFFLIEWRRAMPEWEDDAHPDLQQLKFFCNIYKYVITFSIIYLEQFNI